MRLKTILIATALAGTSMAVYTPADASLGQCDANKMCMWGNNDFKWLIGERKHGVAKVYNMPSGTNNEMDSWANRSANYTGCMYDGRDGGGDRLTMKRSSNDNNMAPWNSDQVTSWRSKFGC